MELEQKLRYISAESLGGSSHGASNPLRETVREFMAGIRSFVNSSNSELNRARVSLFMPDRKLNQEIKTRNYTDIQKVTVYIPVGMSAPWIEYLDHLSAAVDICSNVKNEVLDPAATYVAYLLSEPERLANALDSQHANKVSFHTTEIEAVKKGIASCFESKSEEPMTHYGRVFLRNQEFEQVTQDIRVIVDKMSKVNTGDLVEAADNMGKNLDKLYLRMRSNPEEYRLSNTTANEMSELIYNTAKELEFVAAVAIMVQVAEKAISDTTDKLKAAFL